MKAVMTLDEAEQCTALRFILQPLQAEWACHLLSLTQFSWRQPQRQVQAALLVVKGGPGSEIWHYF